MPPQQTSSDPYGFIMDPQKPKRPPLFGGSMKARISVVSAGIILLIIIAVVISSMLGSSDKVQKQRLIEVAQAQTEIVRISSIASQKASTTETKSLAVTTRLSVQSSENQTVAALSKYGVKANSKVFAQGKNTKTDALLAEATKNNRFDETYKQILSEQLTNYQKLLKASFDSGTKKEKVFLSNAGSSNTLILGKMQKG